MNGRLPLRSILAFALVALVWGSTWLVIKDQISTVPPGWTIAWRFALATMGMVLLAAIRGDSMVIGAPAMRIAALVGLFQFCANFQFVYRAEHYLTSGIVSVIFALLLVPNSLLSWIFFGTRPSSRFLGGSAVALGGIALLLLHEYRLAPPGTAVPLGAALTLCGLLSASVANVLQASPAARSAGIVPVIAWSMAIGTLADVALALVIDGPPTLVARPQYWAGIGYLALVGSVLTFPLYFGLIRTIGAGKAAYNGVVVPVIAMGLSTLFEGYRWTELAMAGSVLALIGLLIALSGSQQRA